MMQQYVTNKLIDEETTRRREKEIYEMNLYLYYKLGDDARFVLDEDIGLSFMDLKKQQQGNIHFISEDIHMDTNAKAGFDSFRQSMNGSVALSENERIVRLRVEIGCGSVQFQSSWVGVASK